MLSADAQRYWSAESVLVEATSYATKGVTRAPWDAKATREPRPLRDRPLVRQGLSSRVASFVSSTHPPQLFFVFCAWEYLAGPYEARFPYS